MKPACADACGSVSIYCSFVGQILCIVLLAGLLL